MNVLTDFCKTCCQVFMAISNFLYILGLASDLWSMLTFTKKNTDDFSVNEQNDFHETPLATQSLLLILVISHHWTTQSNPYRSSLFSCLDSQGKLLLFFNRIFLIILDIRICFK